MVASATVVGTEYERLIPLTQVALHVVV